LFAAETWVRMDEQPSQTCSAVMASSGLSRADAELEALRREVERLRVLASKDQGLLRTLLERSPQGIVMCDAQGRLVLQNRSAERIWGGSVSADSVHEWGKYRGFHEDGTPFAPEDWALAICLRTREPVEPHEFRIQRFDDSYAYVLCSSAPVFGADGSVEGAIAVFADTTRLTESEARARQLQSDLANKVKDLEAFARRASLLQRFTAALTRAQTVKQIAEILTDHGKELFGASACGLYLVDEHRKTLRLLSFRGIEREFAEAYQAVDLAEDQPIARATRAAEALFLGSYAEIVAAHPPAESVMATGPRFEGLVVLPLSDGGHVFATLVFSFAEAPELDDVQRDFFHTVASQCAVSIVRARSFEAQQRANERLAREQQRSAMLAAAGETLSAALDSRQALSELGKLIVPTLVDWYAMDELAEDGTIRRVAVAHRDPEKIALAQRFHDRYPPRPDQEHGVPRVLRTGETQFVPHIPDEILAARARDDEHLTLARSLRLSSFAVVPLKARGRVLGALSLVTENGRLMSQEDVAFAEELARRAALALDNARLYEAAEGARAQLHDLIMNAPFAIGIVRGPSRTFELANEPFEELVGTTGLAGRRLAELSSEHANEELVSVLGTTLDRGTACAVGELAVRRESRSAMDTRWVNVTSQPIRDPAGNAEGIAAFAFDVTDQVVARSRIQTLADEVTKSEARMRALVDATAAVVWTTTANGQVKEASPSWLLFTGQSAEEYLEGAAFAAIHPEDRADTEHAWCSAVASGAPYAAEYRLRRADGSYAYTLARAMPVRGADGAVLEYVGCNIDVSALREAQELAREHADTVATINELGKVIAAELDTQKVVQAVTDAATELTDAQFGAFFYNVLDEQGGKYMLYTLSGVDRAHFSKFPMPRNTGVFAPTFTGEGVVRVDDITKDPRYGKNAPHYGMPKGHLPVCSYLAAPVISRTGEVIGGIFLGHEKPGVFCEKAETLVVGLAAQATVAMDNARLFGDAQRLIRALEATNQELDQFAYVTSHDLKAPLRGIGSLAEWIEEDLGGDPNPQVRRNLDLLKRRVRRMEGLIQGILDYSRAARSSGKRENIDVRQLMGEISDMLAPVAPQAIHASSDLPTVRGERVALQQVLLNLTSNALKHAGREDAQVWVEARDAADDYEFRVIDNGPGIAPKYHERIWSIFQTLEARDKVENTGIGLAIVKKVVEARGGRVWVESNEGEGATFGFTWPKSEDKKP
jgi:PAS domain S-box-containing protein